MTRRSSASRSILVLSATAGAGHTRAAEALVETARLLDPAPAVRHQDILGYTSPLFRKIYSEAYFAVVNRSPELWGYFYRKTEERGANPKRSPLVRIFDHFNYRRYQEAIEKLRPDAIICTHFLPYAAIADKLAAPGWEIPFYSVPTDFDAHALWVNPSVSRYYVANQETSWTLESHGIPPEKIRVTGIPIMPSFARSGRSAARAEFGVAPSAFTIMIASGGYGINVADNLVPGIAEFLARYPRKKFHLLIACGKNRPLHEKLSRIQAPPNVSISLFGYVPFVDRLMECSDVIVTKSGGLTTAEALAKGLPMLILDPIPGQEGRNADYVVENGAGFRPATIANLQFRLRELVDEPGLLPALRARAKALGRPFAARTILKDILSDLARRER